MKTRSVNPWRRRVGEALILVLLLVAAAEIWRLGVTIGRLREEIAGLRATAPTEDSGERIRFGDPVFPLETQLLSGRRFQLEPGRTQVVLYLSPSCGSCAKMAPAWRTVIASIGREHVIVAMPALNRDAATETNAYLARHQLTGVRTVQLPWSVVERLGLYAVPRTILVDSRGRLAYIWRGAVDPADVARRWQEAKAKGGKAWDLYESAQWFFSSW